MKTKLLRMVSIAGSTSFTGIYYAVILALATHYLPLFRQRLHYLVGLAFCTVLLIAVVLTFNRGTWVGILFGLAVMTLQGQIDWRRIFLAAVLFAGIITLTTTDLFGEWEVEQKVTEFIYYSSSSAQSRLIRWVSGVNVLIAHPFLGVGFNNYAFVYGNYSVLEGIQQMYGSPHNMYVDVVTGTGLLGLSVFIALLLRLWRRLRDNIRLVTDPELNILSRGIFLALLFFLGSGAFDSFLFKPHHSTYLIVSTWCMGAAIYRWRTGALTGSIDNPPAQPDDAAEKRP